MTQVVATEFFVSVSMSDLVRWQDDGNGACEPEPSLMAALKAAALTVDVKDLYFRYFDEIQVGHGMRTGIRLVKLLSPYLRSTCIVNLQIS